MRAKFIRNVVSVCMAVTAALPSRAQDASRVYIEPTGWSIGTHLGMTDLWGDVGTKSFVDHYVNSNYFDKVTFMGGMFGRYTVHPCLAFRGMLSVGTVYATDLWNEDKAKLSANQGTDAFQRFARYQTAKTDIVEANVMVEFTPMRRNPEKKRAYRKGQPYMTAGLGFFRFNPKSTVGLDETYIPIYELHIEGDGFGPGFPDAYSLWQISIPMGIGYRWDIGEHLNLGIEYLYRMTFCDYLDGVSAKYIGLDDYAKHLSPSQAATAAAVADKGYLAKITKKNAVGNMRGNPETNDHFSSLQINFYYKIFSRTQRWWLRH